MVELGIDCLKRSYLQLFEDPFDKIPYKKGDFMDNDAITKEMLDDFVHVAEVELSTEEFESILAKMNDQLAVIHELTAIPLEGNLPPVIHGNPFPEEIQAPLREDVWIPFEHPEDIISQAPRTQDGYIVSPDVPHQKLG